MSRATPSDQQREKHGAGVEQARHMIESFARLGAERFDVTMTDLAGRKQSFRAAQPAEWLWREMPALLPAAIARQHNVIVRPRGARLELVQLDDLGGALRERLRGVAFLILATSGGSYQAWLAVRDASADWVRRLRRGSGADPSASGAARLAGSVNFKPRYAPEFPIVRIVENHLGRSASRAELEALGLVAAVPAPPPVPRRRVSFAGRAKSWPSYERCLQNAPPARQRDRRDVSRADFTFCLLAIDWGWSVEQTCQRLLENSPKARAHGRAYAWRTAQRAAAVVERRGRRSGSGESART